MAMTITPGVELSGTQVRLRPRTEHDLPLFVRWYSDPEVVHWLHLSEAPATTAEIERERFEMGERDPSRQTWVIETTPGQPIGSVILPNIDYMHGRAELGISIGEKEYWGRGYGSDAIRTVLRYAFDVMGLRRVGLITDIDNERGIRSYEKCGFVREGVLRQHRMRHGEPIDMIAMAVLREEAK